jgi:hypothetical protein
VDAGFVDVAAVTRALREALRVPGVCVAENSVLRGIARSGRTWSVAAASAGLDPDRLSFMRSIDVVRRQVTDQAAFPPRRLTTARFMAISEILERVNKGRRKRTYPRVIKKCIRRTYPVKQPGEAGGAYDPVISIRHPLTA